MFAVGTIPAFAQRFKPMIIVGFLALSLAIGVAGSANHVGAERVPPGGDSLQQECFILQNHYLGLAHEYQDATPERRAEILADAHNTGLTWQQIGCQAEWGDMVTAPLSDPKAATPGRVNDGTLVLSNPTTPAPVTPGRVGGAAQTVSGK